jgi:hypothetical protein
MQSPRHTLVSNALSIGDKRETNGNENGNGAETKAASLCRNGNETKTKRGNTEKISSIVRYLKRGPFFLTQIPQ